MKFNRGTPLRICDVNVAHCSRYHRVAKDALHLGQVNARFQKIGSATVTKLMNAVNRNLRTARDGVHSVADGET